MKIIAKDNLDRDFISDELVADGITDDIYGKAMEMALNDRFCVSNRSEKSFLLVADSYKLYTFEP
jgi:hypothetical protein